ncbi:MAG: hypothetical protein ABSA78_19605 [Candidatus Sulfotelmatobacter sp.]|jgi:hypothetical protein
MSNIAAPYLQTLEDLEKRRAKCVEDLKTIDAAITGLRAAMGLTFNINLAAAAEEPTANFADLSVRKAVLRFLLQHSQIPMKTGSISDSLLAGGNEKATRANVSAVLSAMKQNGEIARTENGGYILTEQGIAAANYLAASE